MVKSLIEKLERSLEFFSNSAIIGSALTLGGLIVAGEADIRKNIQYNVSYHSEISNITDTEKDLQRLFGYGMFVTGGALTIYGSLRNANERSRFSQ